MLWKEANTSVFGSWGTRFESSCPSDSTVSKDRAAICESTCEILLRRNDITYTHSQLVGSDSAVGIVTRYRLDGPGIESRRSQWPSGLRRGSAAVHLLGLRVRIPLGAWMFVLYVLCEDIRQNAGHSRQRNKYGWIAGYKRIKKKAPLGAVLCVLYSKDKKGKMQENQDAETRTDKLQREKNKILKQTCGGEIFRIRPDGPWGLPTLTYSGGNHPLPSSAEVKERVELYLYSRSGSS